MKRKLKEVLHALNVLDEERDIWVDGYNPICVSAPVKITKAGREHFAEALEAEMYDSYTVSNSNESVDTKAYELLTSLAGYCPCSDFALWFEGDDATEI